MEVKKPIFCSLAFGSASINSYGEYIPCCNIRTEHWKMYKDGHYDYGVLKTDPIIRINAPNLKEVRKSLIDGDWPTACTNCKEAEEKNVGSMRTIWNKELMEYDIPMVEQVDNKSIRYLDLTFGTTCNSKCMTCSSDLSDFWTEESTKIWNIQPEQQKIIKRILIDGVMAEKLVNDFPNVTNISFLGGEPTISEEHIKFLQLLIEKKRSKNIRISYVTNLTGITNELIELWENFKGVHISVSIDGYKKVNEYIRYPFKWSKVESKLRTYMAMVQQSELYQGVDKTRFSLGLSCTVSLFNSIQCVDLLEFWINTLKEYKITNGSLLHTAGCFVNRVSNPSYALVALLSNEYRQQGITKAEKLLQDIENFKTQNPNEQVNHGLIESITLIIEWLQEPQIVNSTYLSQNKHFITESDKFRNRSLQDYIPELQLELDKIWKNGIIVGDYLLPYAKQETVHNQLIDGPGYVIDNIIPNFLIQGIHARLQECYPVRASSKSKQYAERDDIKNLPDISVWWSQTVNDWIEVQKIASIVTPYIRKYLPAAEFYSSDIVFIEKETNYISPHVDTPHRFRKWNYDRNLLGIQVIVTLYDVDSEFASTGIVPHSQKIDFDINQCYRGNYNEYFLKNFIQPPLTVGSILVYNCRLLHSCMPNPQSRIRPSLLLNYLDKSIIEEVTKIDNIWSSNNISK
jgi:organic radical activating enzyme